ncbi:MAG: hypothetical protein K2H30_04050 [Clostridia bacterium]|nr:hypothetical protein [Clostridia bacterium]
MKIHNWTFEENRYCVEQAFENFVINKENDFETVIFKLYLHFDGAIKKGSLKMKLQNIKYLFNKYNVPNTLYLGELQNTSEDNEYAFIAVCKKYLFKKV